MSAVYRPMSICKKSARINNTDIFQTMPFYIYTFSRKIGIWGKYLYVSHTLCILYLERNRTLFVKKLYFIWKISSGNTGKEDR